MYYELFEELGLSPNEAKIYETFLQTGETGVSEISTRGNIHRRNVYDALNRLLEKGLVYKIMGGREVRFRPVNPSKLLELVKEKEVKLTRVLPELKTIFNSEPQHEAAYIYKGLEGYKNYRRDLLRVAQDTYFLGAKALWYSSQVSRSYHQEFMKMAKSKKIKYYNLFDPEVPKKIPEVLQIVGGEYKVLPEKYATTGVVDIFGEYVVTFTSVGAGKIDESALIFVMKNRDLSESYKTWFRFMWDMCPYPSPIAP